MVFIASKDLKHARKQQQRGGQAAKQRKGKSSLPIFAEKRAFIEGDRYTSYLTVNNQKGLLRPGMTATARIVTDSRENVLLVPNTALRFTPKQAATENKSSAVNSLVMPARNAKQKTAKETGRQGMKRQRTLWVLKDGKLESIKVTTGATDGTKTEIVSGDLSEGAKVVTGQLRSTR